MSNVVIQSISSTSADDAADGPGAQVVAVWDVNMPNPVVFQPLAGTTPVNLPQSVTLLKMEVFRVGAKSYIQGKIRLFGGPDGTNELVADEPPPMELKRPDRRGTRPPAV
jgi:hypothetical protein